MASALSPVSLSRGNAGCGSHPISRCFSLSLGTGAFDSGGRAFRWGVGSGSAATVEAIAVGYLCLATPAAECSQLPLDPRRAEVARAVCEREFWE